MTVRYTQKALDDLEDLPKNVAERIFDKMEWYAKQSFPLHLAEPLRGKPEGASHRFRIGAYRVLVNAENHCLLVIVVLAVRHRSEAYQL